MKNIFNILGAIVLAAMLSVALSSCSNYQKLLKSTDYETKYTEAVKYYYAQDYYRAYPLFEELITIFKGKTKAEKTYYFYAYCQYGLGEYELSAFHFDNFVRTFPNSEYAEECMYMNAYCYYVDSPGYSLDQTNTAKAINELMMKEKK